jgi:hypothetical protein
MTTTIMRSALPSFLNAIISRRTQVAFRAPGAAEHNKRVAPREGVSDQLAKIAPGAQLLLVAEYRIQMLGKCAVTLLAGANEIAWHLIAL